MCNQSSKNNFVRLTAIKISSAIPTVEFNLHFGILKYLLKP